MELLTNFLPAAGVLVVVIAILAAADRVLGRKSAAVANGQFRHQTLMLGLTAAGILVFLLALPIGADLQVQLLKLIGVVLSAAIALASTTLLGNALAGIMIRVVRSFKMGDFIRAGDHFGRVSERGLFHTEIQNEFRELTTLPNLFLVTHPVTTLRRSGTIVAATVSLGYDVDRIRVEHALLEAARKCRLKDPFVQVKELGDFAVTYQIAGLLSDVKVILTKRSDLRGATIDALHDDGIEIVSPVFHNQKDVSKVEFIPDRGDAAEITSRAQRPERILFDKADVAASIEALESAHLELCKEIEELSERSIIDPSVTESLHKLEERKEKLGAALAERKTRVEEDL